MIKVFEPSLTYKDKLSVLKALSRNYISGTSPVVKEFEEKTAKTFDRKYAVAVTSGSVALDVAFQLINLDKNDEVIIPSFTIISCLSAVVRTGAKPVFCDVNSEDWNLDLNNLKKCVTSKTKAVLMVHTYGLVSDAHEISKFCKDNNIYLIEDAAEAHGQTVEEKKCGSFGDISLLSFYANKHITTGEGGMVLTDKKEYRTNALNMRNLDFSEKRFVHENLYWNYRMSSLQASLGLSQLQNLEKVIKNKIKQGSYYLELLESYQDYFQLPLKKNKNANNHFWVFGLVLKKNEIRDMVIRDLNERGIETRPFFWPLHLQPSLPKSFLSNKTHKVAEYLGENGLYIPIGDHVKKTDQRYIVKNLIEVFENR